MDRRTAAAGTGLPSTFDALALSGGSEAVRVPVGCVRCLSGGPDLYGGLVPLDGG